MARKQNLHTSVPGHMKSVMVSANEVIGDIAATRGAIEKGGGIIETAASPSYL